MFFHQNRHNMKNLRIFFTESLLSRGEIIMRLIVGACISGALTVGGIYQAITAKDFSLIPIVIIGMMLGVAVFWGINPKKTENFIFRR